MKRKTFIKRLGYGSGATLLLPSAALLGSCSHTPIQRTALTQADVPFLDGISETILPSTPSVPGAKEAGVGTYISLMYNDCMAEKDRSILVEGLNLLHQRCAHAFKKSFVDADAEQRLSLLEAVQAEATAYKLRQEGETEVDAHYFDILKGLVLSGYFTSEIGMTQAREYVPVPGKFVACMPYSPKDKVWAL
jgi:hypothetical protein